MLLSDLGDFPKRSLYLDYNSVRQNTVFFIFFTSGTFMNQKGSGIYYTQVFIQTEDLENFGLTRGATRAKRAWVAQPDTPTASPMAI
jgi:hypothetical protein